MKVFSDPLYRKSLIIMVSSLAGGVLNYLYNPLVARLLTAAQYGELLTMFAILNVLTIPASTNAIVTTQYVSRYIATGDEGALGGFMRKMYRQVSIISVGLIAVFLVLLPLMVHFFHFSSGAALLLLGVSIPAAFITPVVQGVIQGRQQFMRLSVINVASPLVKIIGVSVAMVLGYQLTGIIGILGIGSIAVAYAAFRWARIRRPLDDRPAGVPSTRELLNRGTYALLANIGLILLLNIDLFITKRYLSPDLAGQYGTISLLGKAIFFFGGSLALVLFPMVLSRHAKNESSASVVSKALFAMSAITTCVVAVFAVGGPPIVRLLFGARYLNFSSVLWLTGIVFGLYSVIYILSMFFLATPSRRFVVPLLGACVVIPLAFALGPHTVEYLMYVMIGTFTVVVVLLLSMMRRIRYARDIPAPVTVIEPPL